MLERFEITLANCPAHFHFCFPKCPQPDVPGWMLAWGGAGGRAISGEKSEIYAVFEAIERACLMSSDIDDTRINNYTDGAGHSISTAALVNLSARQIAQLGTTAPHDTIKSLFSGDGSRSVCGIEPFKGETIRIPALSVLFGEDARVGLPPVFASSSGAALRETPEAAFRHGTLELVERDGVAIWWYNRLVPPRLADAGALPDDLAHFLHDRPRKTWHLLLPTDLGVPAIVALSARADGTAPAIGCAAALDPASAVLSATLELLQGEINLMLMRQAQAGPNPPPVPPLLDWSARTNAFATDYLAGAGHAELPPPCTWDDLLATLQEKRIDLYHVDLTRPEFGIPVAKAVSPQLRDWLPRFGPGRLYDVPVALGLRRHPTAEDALNPIPFVI